ncbi:glycosyltransferase [Weissella confusa]|uniref:Glycosyltransferase n=1 Tax=Weissella fermenti TaxID=2987699 RepID=A0ABT6D1C9_9LACO|nr:MULTISPECIES: glycosyltransferase [Weissella]MBJ7689116.1 glycosyltransferase [Weissella confusa]MCW0926698.1 glycosyltransferase [Weissella sp. LMG 11983]MDF9299127.1 glycosyltransferase [Weissella sp. BK2]
MKKLSLIMPVYNVKSELMELLFQLKGLDLKDIEIIFIDDGSTDGSAELLESFNESVMHGNMTIISQCNKGVSAARNAGLIESTAEFIWFIDPDDLINIDLLGVVFDSLDKYDLIQFSYDRFSQLGDIEWEKHIPSKNITSLTKNNLFKKLATEEVEDYPWAHIAKKSLYVDNNLIFPVGRKYEDMATTYKLFQSAEKIGYFNVPLVYYRQREGSTVHTPTNQYLDDCSYDEIPD